MLKQSTTEPEAIQVRQIPVQEIAAFHLAAREGFNDEADERLARSIGANGLLQPVIARPCPRCDGPHGKPWELVAGHRRWRAAYRAGLATIPAIVRQVTDTEALLLSLVENEDREALNPIDLARCYRCLMDAGLTQQQIADHVGSYRPNVANVARLLTLPEEVRGLLSKGKLSMSHGVFLLPVKDPERCVALARQAAAEEWPLRLLRQHIDGLPTAAKLPRDNSDTAPCGQTAVPTHAPASLPATRSAGALTSSPPPQAPRSLDASPSKPGQRVCLLSRTDMRRLEARADHAFVLRIVGHCENGKVPDGLEPVDVLICSQGEP